MFNQTKWTKQKPTSGKQHWHFPYLRPLAQRKAWLRCSQSKASTSIKVKRCWSSDGRSETFLMKTSSNSPIRMTDGLGIYAGGAWNATSKKLRKNIENTSFSDSWILGWYKHIQTSQISHVIYKSFIVAYSRTVPTSHLWWSPKVVACKLTCHETHRVFVFSSPQLAFRFNVKLYKQCISPWYLIVNCMYHKLYQHIYKKQVILKIHTHIKLRDLRYYEYDKQWQFMTNLWL